MQAEMTCLHCSINFAMEYEMSAAITMIVLITKVRLTVSQVSSYKMILWCHQYTAQVA